jgi:hypothetical protein
MRKAMSKKLTTLGLIGVALSMSGAAMAVGQVASGMMTITATMTSGCSLTGATMTFAAISPFATADLLADTGQSLKVTCTGVAAPGIGSGSARVLTGPEGETIAFGLGQVAGTYALPVIATGEAIVAPFASNGIAQVVTLHGKILAADYLGKPAGAYTASIKLDVNY